MLIYNRITNFALFIFNHSWKMKKTNLFTILSLLILASCNSFKPVKTIDNLKAGIKGEMLACAMYSAFAEKAKAEGHDTIAKLFDAISISEGIHIINLRKVLESLGQRMENFKPEYDVKTTEENIQVAIDEETFETKTIYPLYFNEAKNEKAGNAVHIFRWEFYTELKHLSFFQQALNAIQNKTEGTLPFQYAVCPVCGNTYDYATLENKCAFCGLSKDKFR